MTEKLTTRIPIKRGRPLNVVINNQPAEAYAGETVAAVLLTSGHVSMGPTENTTITGGLYCGMGVCFSCLVTVNGVPYTRACVTPVTEGMAIEIERRRDE